MSLSLYLLYLFLNYNAKIIQNFNTDKSLLKKNNLLTFIDNCNVSNLISSIYYTMKNEISLSLEKKFTSI